MFKTLDDIYRLEPEDCVKCKERSVFFCLKAWEFVCCNCCGFDIQECLKGEKSDEEMFEERSKK
jgi:hypothetical protein